MSGRASVAAAFVACLVSALVIGVGPAQASGPAGCDAGLPVVAHRAGGERAVLPAGSQLPVACAAGTGYPTSESTLALGGDGTLVYSPAKSENTVARSTDGGATWTLTAPAHEQQTELWNTTDPDVIADRRTGRLFWVRATHLMHSPAVVPKSAALVIAYAYGFQVYRSSDGGRQWGTADYSTAPTGDWEKIFVGPPPPQSTGAAQPTGYPDVVYVCANSPFEVIGPGRLCYKSLDGGATFRLAGYVSPGPSTPQDICPPLNFNTGVVDGSGATYQPVDCARSAYVVVSRDEGATYSWLSVPDAPTGTAASGTNLKLAVDDAGNLYAIWTENGLLYLAVSKDHARSWAPAMMVAGRGLRNVELPAVAAGASGHVAVTYYAGADPSAQTLSAYITQTADATDRQPLFYTGALNDPAKPVFHEYGGSDAPRADFIGGAFDSAGTSFWAGVVKQLGPPQPQTGDIEGAIPTTGLVGTLRFSGATPTNLAGGG